MAGVGELGAFALTEPEHGSDVVRLEGTDSIQSLIVGRAITGLSAFA